MNRWLVHHILWPAQERLRGRGTTAILRRLRATERLPPAVLRGRQLTALRAVLARAAEATAYYRRAFAERRIRPDALTDLADLAAVPFLTKALIRAHLDEMVDPGARRRLRPYATSGSTGEPLSFYVDRRRSAADNAARARAWAWWGVTPGARTAQVWGSRLELGRQGPLRRWRDRMMNTLVLPATDLGPAALGEMAAALARFRPTVIFGYATAVARLAEFLIEEGRTDAAGLGEQPAAPIRPRVVVTTAEMLLPAQREAIRSAFRSGVATEYGARELGVVAGECPEERLHIAAEQALIEVVEPDGERVLPPGRTGELIVTLLGQYAMPMIRYRTGDLGRLSQEPCPCGLGLPVLASVEGRSRDVLRFSGGRVVHPSVFTLALGRVPGLLRYRVVQTARDQVVIRAVMEKGDGSPFRNEGRPTPFSAALEQVRAELGPSIAVMLEPVADLPIEPSGKFRWVVGLADGE